LESRPDEQLVILTQQGDIGAFNRLATRVETSVYRFVLRTLGDREDARDVCQDALLKAYQNIGRLRDGRKFRAWVHHIALNLCRDRFRSPAHRRELRPGTADDDSFGEKARAALEQEDPSAPHLRTERFPLVREIEEALGLLPAEQRVAILLREYHGFTSEEIGEITGVPAATVRTRIFYGLRALRQTLRAHGIE
jgi:RNA polymerase sigma-70 factor (ECF subfamily)